MSRGSIRTFLLTAKRHLNQTIKNNGHLSLVLGNESADLDSITCALLYGYIQSSRPQAQRSGQLFIPITNIPAADLSLRPELTALLQHAAIQPSELITLDDLSLDNYPPEQTSWVLVDHNVFQGALGQRFSSRVDGVIDHHEDEKQVPGSAAPRIIDKSGSCTSLVANHCREAWTALAGAASSAGAAAAQDGERVVDDAAYARTWDAQAALLALGAILVDTIDLRDPHKVTDHDRAAVRFLEALVHASRQRGAAYDRDALFRELDAAKSDLDGLSLYDILRKDYKQWADAGLTLGVAAVVQPLEYLRGKKGEGFAETLVRFASDRELPLVAVMTAYTTEAGDFERELLLVALEDGKAKEAAERFVAASRDELQLEDTDTDTPSEAVFAQAWKQKNLAASRKQVAPLLREALRS